MAVTVRGTDILFNDGTTQNTAAPGARAWQSATLSNNTNATNSYGKEITVAARCNANGSYGWTDYCYVNDTIIVQATWNAAVVGMTYIFEVPAGATYKVNFPTGIAGVMILR